MDEVNFWRKDSSIAKEQVETKQDIIIMLEQENIEKDEVIKQRDGAIRKRNEAYKTAERLLIKENENKDQRIKDLEQQLQQARMIQKQMK